MKKILLAICFIPAIFGQTYLRSYKISSLPSPSLMNGQYVMVVDGNTPTDCTTGNGSPAYAVVCVSNGTTYTAQPIGSPGNGSVTSFSAPTGNWPGWLTPSVTNSTTTPSLSVSAGVVPVANGGTGTSSPSINGGTGISITGSFPGQTISVNLGSPLAYLRAKANSITPTVEYAPLWGVNPSDYSFTVSPSGSLTASSAATVTIPYGPLGLNGSDSNHYVYISGTGTPEPVLITGGTCTSGLLSNCTIQFTPANSHSSGYVLSTATGGLQEALNAVGNILVPHGLNVNVYAPITPPVNSTVWGVNEGASQITNHNLTSELFHIINDRFTIGRITLSQSGTPVSGNVGIRTYGPRAVITGNSQWVEIQNLFIVGFYNGIIAEANSQLTNATNVVVANSISDGIDLLGAQGYWRSVTSLNNGGNGFFLGTSPSIGGCIVLMSDIQTFNNNGWGISSISNTYISGGNTYLNNDKFGELLISTSSADAGYIADANIQFSGQTASWGTQTNSPGILIQSSSGPFTISNVHIFNTQGDGITTNSSRTTIIGTHITGSGQGGSPSNLYSIASTNASQMNFISNYVDSPSLFNGDNMVITGNHFTGNFPSFSFVNISGGSDIIFDDNNISNPGNSAFGINTGVTYQHGNNIISGSINNLGALSSKSSAL